MRPPNFALADDSDVSQARFESVAAGAISAPPPTALTALSCVYYEAVCAYLPEESPGLIRTLGGDTEYVALKVDRNVVFIGSPLTAYVRPGTIVAFLLLKKRTIFLPELLEI